MADQVFEVRVMSGDTPVLTLITSGTKAGAEEEAIDIAVNECGQTRETLTVSSVVCEEPEG